KDHHIRALHIISLSKSRDLLNKFPKFLKYWFNKYNKTDDLTSPYKIPIICSQWYYSMLAHTNFATEDWKYVYNVFENLSFIHKTIKDQPEIFNRLIEIAVDRCNQCSDNRIFKATKHIYKFDQDLITPFAKMVKGKLLVKDIDDSLMHNMQQICSCGSDVLDVPNLLCEEILLYVVEILKDLHPLSGKSNSEISSTSLTLLRHSRFWNLILNPTGEVIRLKSHPYIKQARNIIQNFEIILLQESITFQFLQRLLLNPDDKLVRFFASDRINKSTIIKLRNQSQSYLNKKDRLHTFYTRFCSQDKINDLNSFLDDINERSAKLDNLTLKETQAPSHWIKHNISIEAANMVYEFIESQTFKNIFEKIIKNEGGSVSMENLVRNIIPLVIKTYTKYIQQYEYENWKTLNCSSQTVLWQKVNHSNVRKELDFLKIRQTEKLVQTIKYMTNFPTYVERLQQLNEILLIFKVSRIKDGWLGTMLIILENEYLWLGALNDFFKYYNKHLPVSDIDDNCWELIKSLSTSSGFVKWLKSIAEHNIKNLINSVDDQSDERLIQEETMSSLIQVHQVLVPLIKSEEALTVKKFLRKLSKIVATNPQLGQKIALCNSNRKALENLVKNIDNKTEVTQERISNSVKKGTFTFQRLENDDKCTAILSYTIHVISEKEIPILEKQATKFTLNDLLDLRGRALLISKPGITMDVENLEEEEGRRQKSAKKTMNEFVEQVDLAQEICEYASELIQMGHFKYRRFNKNVKGVNQMEYLLDELKADLEEWGNIVNKAQEQYYYLTFFPARQILVFYDYFKQTAKDEASTIEECKVLINFINNFIELPPPDVVLNNLYRSKMFDDIINPTEETNDKKNELVDKVFEQSHYKDLCVIGKILQYLFRNIYNKPKRVSQGKIERVKSDFVFSGKLFVAACNDKSLVPNIIMSLYVNHESYPQPWQILICTSSTTMEELSIFIKRCFFAAKNEYEGYLFCIANLELVEFELQYGLVNIIRSMSEEHDKYLLALICCREPGVHHHILDQFSQDVHTTNGLGMESMKRIYQELCPEAFCVTSELSGLGKTEWIKNKSFDLKKTPKSFLINDNVDFRTLVKRFKEFKIQPFESLHLNIVSSDHPLDVNMFIFELLTLGMVVNSIHIARLLNTTIFIEVADQYLFKSIPIVQCLANTNLKWDIRDLKASNEIHSPIQIVCHYLYAFERTIDAKNLLFQITGPDAIKPLSDEECQEFINKYLFDNGTSKQDITSFRFVEIFVNVFADQLVRFSSSQYFQVENLKVMTREKEIRKTLLRTLLDVSKDFATLSVKTKSAQLESTITLSNNNIINDKLASIISWDDSNHLLVFFLSQIPDSICALYRDEKRVPENVKRLLRSQNTDNNRRFQLENYNTMDTKQLLEKLECIARKTMHKIKYPRYALSADNIIKMALILLRARASIPVIVCGEAGCGKTSLIGFLSQVVEVKFKSLDLHAGVTEENILSFMTEAQKIADTSETWLFFDEINTCNHICLLADLIAHRMFHGRQIHPNIRLFAACNPYRIRTKDQSNVGLSTKAKKKEIRYEERSDLVYQVKPLPDQILDYVWDYGVLQEKEEERYIQTMVSEELENEFSNTKTFAKLIFRSQIFIRKVEEPYSVSLRDVKRAITLAKFFKKSLKNRPQINPKKRYPPNDEINISLRCYVLTLGLCYQCRLYDQTIRKEYRKEMALIISDDINKETKRKYYFSEEIFNYIIRQEQEDYIDRMTCPPNTAKNEALLENVLVMIVCILTKIPVFIIGAPGSSKSLAVRLVSQNLKGFDSEDEYFRTLPQAYLIPHQGSSSSTSDGILKVFEKANNYQKTTSKEFPVISVVLLDEVGLAETSPFNPLKVLHYLLEPPYGSDGPTVSVIGISNWRLDNSKSSRALLVQRPKFDLDDLVDTAVRLLSPKVETNEIQTNITKVSLKPLAEAYSIYEQTGQQFPNFHGLRDYYALVKSLSLTNLTPKNIQKALTRNFGGTDKTQELCEKYFAQVLRNFNQQREWEYIPLPIEDLINANLDDKEARHLMVIGKSDSIVNWLTYKLRNRNLDPVVILGSQFPDDQDDYSYSVLSRIMMCVETGRPLILTDLEIIYGSLYDLWNQNYIVAGSADNPKYYTRVALGAYANPMLYVHETFRCILVLDETKLKTADPPLLNRFEKQKMTIKDTLTTHEFQIVEQLLTWVEQMSKIFGTQDNQSKLNEDFTQKDLFIGFDPDETVQSLVIDTKKNYPNSDDQEILIKCKEKLVAIASSDGIIRTEKSELDDDEKKHWKKVYFEDQHHDNIADYIQTELKESKNSHGLQIIINTFSNINTDVKACLDGIVDCQVDKLSTFKTESQLQNRIKDFWLESTDEMLIIQCDVTVVNAGCIKLAKFIIEQFKNEYLVKREKRPELPWKTKHVCILMHIHREQENSFASFNFMCGWDQVTIETLAKQEKSLSELMNKSIEDVINTTYLFESILNQEMLWCLLCMKYPSSIRSIEHINANIFKYPRLLECMKSYTRSWLQEKSTTNWQYKVASDKKLLYIYPSLSVALLTHIRGL
ncbi:6945_t:CDS:10, partial [Scutellospora calospora]